MWNRKKWRGKKSKKTGKILIGMILCVRKTVEENVKRERIEREREKRNRRKNREEKKDERKKRR